MRSTCWARPLPEPARLVWADGSGSQADGRSAPVAHRAHRLSATGPSELRGGYDFYCRSVCTMQLYAKRSESSHCLRNHRSEMAYLFCRNDSRRSDEEKKSNGTGPLNPVMPGAALLHFSDIWEALLLELLSSGFY